MKTSYLVLGLIGTTVIGFFVAILYFAARNTDQFRGEHFLVIERPATSPCITDIFLTQGKDIQFFENSSRFRVEGHNGEFNQDLARLHEVTPEFFEANSASSKKKLIEEAITNNATVRPPTACQ
jgi:hypothetical protein